MSEESRRLQDLLQSAGVAKRGGDLPRAAALYREAVAIAPGDLATLNNLANALQMLNRLDEAIGVYLDTVAIQPHPLILSNLGNAYQTQGNLDKAIICYTHSVAADPTQPATHHNLATALKKQNKLAEATARYRQALALHPEYPEALCGLGGCLQLQGMIDEAVGCYRTALALEPGFAEARNNLLFALNCQPGVTAASLRRGMGDAPSSNLLPRGEEALSYSPPPLAGGGREEGAALRIGYVSGDFRNHPVGYFLAPILEHHDRAGFEIHCYSNSAAADAMTERLRRAVPHWRDVKGLSDQDLAEQIKRDEIDILIDLSGHTADHRLPVFALRPAPVQASWLGYFGTIAMPGIDHIIADAVVLPPGEAENYAERVWHLPGCYLCFSPPDEAPEPAAEAPSIAAGFITFGCFNRRDKITPDAVALWAEIMRALPDSHLILKNHSFADAPTAEALRQAFGREGIATERLGLEGPSARRDYLADYRTIDIALDPFPFAGGTTTAEALWMGVPVVTLCGDTWAGRISASLLHHLGCDELITQNRPSYRDTVLALAGDTSRLAAVRSGLRGRVMTRLCDGARFTRDLENLLRRLSREQHRGLTG